MCPDRELLSAYVDGEVPDPWRGRIESHLQACATCSEAALGFSRIGLALRGDLRASETAIVDRLRRRLDDGLFGQQGSAPHPSVHGFGPFLWRRRISIPLPLAVAAALVIVFLSGLATSAWLFPAGQGIQSMSATELPSPVAQGASMDELIRFLDSQDAQATLTIRLPTGATFDNPGKPVIMRAPVSGYILPGNGGSP